MKTLLITGGAGFIGTNTVDYFASAGWKVIVLDNLSRKGSKDNLVWLKSNKEYSFDFLNIDICDKNHVDNVFIDYNIDALIHLAGQVAVTSSVSDPRNDFSININGTFNLLEAVRKFSPKTIFINASTNKVYGELEYLEIIESEERYDFNNIIIGIDEDTSLDFHSPYGCSKGSADQYVLDYARIYNLNTTSFRQSCIYGPRQFGSEDQGWISWFIYAVLTNKDISIYGNGKQVRDILYVDDLIRAYDMAINNPDVIKGQAFNIGGGVKNSISLLEFMKILSNYMNKDLPFSFEDVRPGDQKVYISDTHKLNDKLGWKPKVNSEQGIKLILDWTENNLNAK
jgi:CDP-paratose 2-epimerase